MKISFDKETLISILDIDKDLFDFKKFRYFAKQNNLLEKQNLHITIIGRETGKLIKSNIKKLPNSKELIKKIIKLINETKWKFTTINWPYFISKTYKEYNNEKRKSLIQFVKMPVLEIFYRKLNKTLKMNLNTPIPHVTLFTNSTKKKTKLRGIGIYSKKQFKILDPKLIK